MSLLRVAFAVLQPVAVALSQPRGLQSEAACNFTNAPGMPHFWDVSCRENRSSLGCLADGQNPECRFCGQGDYKEVLCPASLCSFVNPPHLPYYWDADCSMGKIGCLADGVHVKCRFCGEFPYNGTVPCKAGHTTTPAGSCLFVNEPEMPYFWDATCEDGMLGCRADGMHKECRFCGRGDYSEVKCPASLCTFRRGLEPPAQPYNHYWEPLCWNASAHILGCLADGIHRQCRFCGAGEYKSIPCPPGSSA
mmetsp:Transcript_145625/g.465350  ORF Transcript_145625/g.465350 Transcript_145625/m.465350 type:complete len:250 (-) Transcript_145625:198-947(-)